MPLITRTHLLALLAFFALALLAAFGASHVPNTKDLSAIPGAASYERGATLLDEGDVKGAFEEFLQAKEESVIGSEVSVFTQYNIATLLAKYAEDDVEALLASQALFTQALREALDYDDDSTIVEKIRKNRENVERQIRAILASNPGALAEAESKMDPNADQRTDGPPKDSDSEDDSGDPPIPPLDPRSF